MDHDSIEPNQAVTRPMDNPDRRTDDLPDWVLYLIVLTVAAAATAIVFEWYQ
jgi:hypothetical protein